MTPQRVSAVAFAAVLLALGAAASTSFAGTLMASPDQVVLKLAPGNDLDAINGLWHTSIVDSIPGHGLYLLRLADPSLLEAITGALDDPDKKQFCDYNFMSRTPEAVRQIVVVAIGDTTTVRDQDALARVRAPEAQALSTGEGVLVGILDTGVDFGHPLLSGRLVPGYDFVARDSDASETDNGVDDDGDGTADDGYGHGTMVAGIVTSVAPGARILPVRVLDDEGNGTIFGLLQGLYYALDAGANVVNMSLGLSGTAESLKDALRTALDQGVLVVAAAGNDSSSVLQFPASDGKTLGVTATDSLDVKAYFADWSSAVDLCAPGVGVYSSYRDGGYGLGEGTSFAAPFVSGAYALLRSLYPSSATTDLVSFLQTGAVPVDSLPGNESFQDGLGAGRVDCYGAVLAGASLGAHGPPGSDPKPARSVTGLLSPNPARGEATLRFRLSAERDVRLELYDAAGRRVTAMALGVRPAGEQTAPIALRDTRGRALPSGLYRYVLRAGGESASGALVVRR